MVEPPREALLRQRVLPIREYMNEICGRSKITKAASRVLYGTPTVPIAVPLKPGETEEQYEIRFQRWVYREQSHWLDDLRDRPNLERAFRIRFARAETRAYLMELAEQQNGHEDGPDVKEEENVEVMNEGERAHLTKRNRETESEDEPPLHRIKVEF